MHRLQVKWVDKNAMGWGSARFVLGYDEETESSSGRVARRLHPQQLPEEFRASLLNLPTTPLILKPQHYRIFSSSVLLAVPLEDPPTQISTSIQHPHRVPKNSSGLHHLGFIEVYIIILMYVPRL
jgi:hypothetical protein